MSNYRYPERKCEECGKSFKPRRPEGKFCSTKCARSYAKRNKIGFFKNSNPIPHIYEETKKPL